MSIFLPSFFYYFFLELNLIWNTKFGILSIPIPTVNLVGKMLRDLHGGTTSTTSLLLLFLNLMKQILKKLSKTIISFYLAQLPEDEQ